MSDITREPHPNTVAFSCLEDSVAILIADIIHAIYSILNWRQSSKSFLIEILARLGEENKFECSHLNFAEILFPSLEENVRKVKVGRWSQKLFEDLRDSFFLAVIIVPRRVGKSENGKYYGLPTLYKRGKFWKLFRAVQDAAIECDLLNLPLRNRRQKVRLIVEMYLNKIGAKRIMREKIERPKSEKEKKEKSPSLPCACDCVDCLRCLKKRVMYPENASEAVGVRPAQERITRSEVIAKMGVAFESLYDCAVTWMNLDLDRKEYWRKVNAEIGILDERLADAMKRLNAPRRLKLVGGQSR